MQEGRFSWQRFGTRLALPATATVLSIGASCWSFFNDFRAKFIVIGFATIVGSATLLHLLIWLSNVITHYQLEGETLSFRRLARRTRRISLAQITSVNPTGRSKAGAKIWFQDGSSAYVSFDCLNHGNELAEFLQQVSQENVGKTLTGCLNRSQVLLTLVYQLMLSLLLLSISLFGLMCLGMAFHSIQVPNQWVFLPLGCLLLSLCVVGFFLVVPWYWMHAVRWFHLEDDILSFRTVFRRKTFQRNLGQVSRVQSNHPDSRQDDAAVSYRIHFRDGLRIKLLQGSLQNANALHNALISARTRLLPKEAASRLAPVPSDHPLWPAITPHLQNDEQLLWLDAPQSRKLCFEMAAEVLLGTIFTAIASGVMIPAIWLIVVRGEYGALMLVAVSALFGGIGLSGIAAPWRYQRLLRSTVYAITSQRVLILHGLEWGQRLPPMVTDDEVISLSPPELRHYEPVNRGRDVAIGGRWHVGRKRRRYWAHRGLLAPSDPQTCIAAIEQILSRTDDLLPAA